MKNSKFNQMAGVYLGGVNSKYRMDNLYINHNTISQISNLENVLNTLKPHEYIGLPLLECVRNTQKNTCVRKAITSYSMVDISTTILSVPEIETISEFNMQMSLITNVSGEMWKSDTLVKKNLMEQIKLINSDKFRNIINKLYSDTNYNLYNMRKELIQATIEKNVGMILSEENCDKVFKQANYPDLSCVTTVIQTKSELGKYLFENYDLFYNDRQLAPYLNFSAIGEDYKEKIKDYSIQLSELQFIIL